MTRLLAEGDTTETKPETMAGRDPRWMQQDVALQGVSFSFVVGEHPLSGSVHAGLPVSISVLLSFLDFGERRRLSVATEKKT